MALTTGSNAQVHILEGTAFSGHPVAEITFNMSGTYDTAANSSLQGIAALIQGSRRNGKTVTMRSAMAGRPATRQDTFADLTLKTVAIAGADITFEIAGPDWTTEFTNATTIPAQHRPFVLLCLFTEA